MILLWRLSGTAYLGTLDYGARHYDPRIARWTVPDPMAEKYYWINPYVAYMSNPVMFIDFDGREIRVAKNYQEHFHMDLQSVFGDKVNAARILKLS